MYIYTQLRGCMKLLKYIMLYNYTIIWCCFLCNSDHLHPMVQWQDGEIIKLHKRDLSKFSRNSLT